VILDLPRFVSRNRPQWEELEALLDELERDPDAPVPLAKLRRLHELYRRASADLAQLATFAAERDVTPHLSGLVARAYGELHETRARSVRARPLRFLAVEFPRAVRARARALAVSCALTLLGAAFGAAA